MEIRCIDGKWGNRLNVASAGTPRAGVEIFGRFATDENLLICLGCGVFESARRP